MAMGQSSSTVTGQMLAVWMVMTALPQDGAVSGHGASDPETYLSSGSSDAWQWAILPERALADPAPCHSLITALPQDRATSSHEASDSETQMGIGGIGARLWASSFWKQCGRSCPDS